MSDDPTRPGDPTEGEGMGPEEARAELTLANLALAALATDEAIEHVRAEQKEEVHPSIRQQVVTRLDRTLHGLLLLRELQRAAQNRQFQPVDTDVREDQPLLPERSHTTVAMLGGSAIVEVERDYRRYRTTVTLTRRRNQLDYLMSVDATKMPRIIDIFVAAAGSVDGDLIYALRR